jgi:hypothetical protein
VLESSTGVGSKDTCSGGHSATNIGGGGVGMADTPLQISGGLGMADTPLQISGGGLGMVDTPRQIWGGGGLGCHYMTTFL